MIILESIIKVIIWHRKTNPRYIPGYRIQFPEELQRFRNHRWYIKRGNDYMTMPHWWGTHLLTCDALEYIKGGLYVAIDRKEINNGIQNKHDSERRTRTSNTLQLGVHEVPCLPGA